MDAGSGVWELLTGGATALFSCFCHWIAVIGRAVDIMQLLPGLIIFVLLTILYFISACLASSIAESRGYHPLKHFIIGLFLPVVYPALVWAAFKPVVGQAVVEEIKANAPVVPKLKPKGSGIQFKEAGIVAAQSAPAQNSAESASAETSAAPAPQSGTVTRPDLNPGAVLTQDYLIAMAVNSDGTAAGPFTLTLVDGMTLTVLRILNPLEKLCLFEIPGEKPDEPPKSVRIPYSRMKSLAWKN